VQDDWRVTRKLTLNLGVRYDGESGYVDRHNELNYFDPGIASFAKNASFPNLTGGLVFANTNGTGRAVYTRDHTNVVPRVGFAFAAHNTLAIRGGYGIAYAPLELTNNGVGTLPSGGFSSTTNWNSAIAQGNSPRSWSTTIPSALRTITPSTSSM
jgi:outer membrane receptor protein involved in Fe transport